MNKLFKLITAIVIISTLAAFTTSATKTYEFSFPKRNHTTIQLNGLDFGEFSKEWRGTDYYYYGMSKDSIICSVYFFKLNRDEQKVMIEPFGGMTSPGIPLIYFSDNSNLKKYEENVSGWGEMTDDFMFRQYDILNFEGIQTKQKHMYAFCMFDKDLFVNVHLSKTNYLPADSTTMRQLLNSLVKVK